jgi:hypothetical protein
MREVLVWNGRVADPAPARHEADVQPAASNDAEKRHRERDGAAVDETAFRSRRRDEFPDLEGSMPT